VDISGPPRIARDPISLPLTWTDTGNPAADGWNLVSNPLPSPIDFTAIARGPDVQNSYWIFDPATGNNVIWSAGFSTGGANGILQSSQAFWLRTSGNNISASVLENAKVNTLVGGTFGGLQQQNAPLVRLGITSTINEFSDEALVVFAQGSPARDAAEGDADKMLFGHPAAPRIATLADSGIPMAISMYGPIATDITIPVMLQVGVSGTYTVRVNELVAPGILSCVSLEDLATGAIVPLVEGASYTLEMEAGTDPSEPRLLLHATAPMDFSVVDVACAGGASGQAVLNVEEGPLAVQWTDAFGAVLLEQDAMPASGAVLAELATGNYNVSVVTTTVCGLLSHSFTVAEPFALEVQSSVAPATCSGVADGSIVLDVLGGTAPYGFLWSNGSSTENLEQALPGNYDVTITDANACTLTLTALSIGAAISIEGELLGPAYAGVGEPIAFSTTVDITANHFWNFGDGATSVELAPVHSYAEAGTHTVELSLMKEGCTRTIEHVISVSAATSINEVQFAGMSAWSNGEALVLVNADGIPGDIRVMDATGRMVAFKQLVTGTERLELPTAGWPAGIYHLQFIGEVGRWTTSLPVGF